MKQPSSFTNYATSFMLKQGGKLEDIFLSLYFTWKRKKKKKGREREREKEKAKLSNTLLAFYDLEK